MDDIKEFIIINYEMRQLKIEFYKYISKFNDCGSDCLSFYRNEKGFEYEMDILSDMVYSLSKKFFINKNNEKKVEEFLIKYIDLFSPGFKKNYIQTWK